MKSCGEWWYVCTILDLGTRCRCVVSFTPLPLYQPPPRDRAPEPIGSWVGPRALRPSCHSCQCRTLSNPTCELSTDNSGTRLPILNCQLLTQPERHLFLASFAELNSSCKSSTELVAISSQSPTRLVWDPRYIAPGRT
jgi:hypothetical protein